MTKLVYFAWVRERIGKAEEEIELPDGVTSVSDLIGWLKGRGEEYAYAFENGHLIRAALDRQHAPHESDVRAAREIAFFPPMTGG
jgi:molybdopterin synthase sulfur carrier subunit